jgi:hypothetical protein
MRYKDTGEVHKDFHLATNTSINYILDTYGMATLREVFQRTAQKVYLDIYQHLQKGDTGPLCEHMEYYFEREAGEYKKTENGETITFEVTKCPAVAHLVDRGYEWSENFCLQTKLMNEAWSEGSQINITTEIKGQGHCVQTMRRENASK